MMKGAILIFGGNEEQRTEAAREYLKGCEKADLMILAVAEGKKSYGIEQVREATSFVQKKPFAGDMKAIVIPNAEKLTIEAQNALLKTLEEPPAYASIILLTKAVESLLPTVLSRCQKVGIAGILESGERVGESELRNVMKMTVEKKFAWAQDKAKEEKEDVVEMLENWAREERENLHEGAAKVQNIRLIIEVKEDLEKTNLNCRLALETLILNLR